MKTIVIGLATTAALALCGAASAGVVIKSYNITDAAQTGFGGWGHFYDGTITPTGIGHANGIEAQLADYTGGSGTLNDGIIGGNSSDTQLFGFSSDIDPIITVFLDNVYTISDVTLFSFTGGNSIPGTLAGFDVTINGVTESFLSTEPTDNDEFVNLIGSSLEGLKTNEITFSNFVHDGSNPGLDELFAVSEIGVTGTIVPAPGALALLGFAGLVSRRRRRA